MGAANRGETAGPFGADGAKAAAGSMAERGEGAAVLITGAEAAGLPAGAGTSPAGSCPALLPAGAGDITEALSVTGAAGFSSGAFLFGIAFFLPFIAHIY